MIKSRALKDEKNYPGTAYSPKVDKGEKPSRFEDKPIDPWERFFGINSNED